MVRQDLDGSHLGHLSAICVRRQQTTAAGPPAIDFIRPPQPSGLRHLAARRRPQSGLIHQRSEMYADGRPAALSLVADAWGPGADPASAIFRPSLVTGYLFGRADGGAVGGLAGWALR